MGLIVGCYTCGDKVFEKKYKVTIEQCDHGRSTHILDPNTGTVLLLSGINGDCTAASLNSEHCEFQLFIEKIPMLLEYLSLNARISCFFSRNVHKEQLESALEKLKQFPIMGLHVQKSNRDPYKATYMITGLLKVPNPYINNYNKWGGEDYSHHNHLDSSKFNEVNQNYNLPTL